MSVQWEQGNRIKNALKQLERTLKRFQKIAQGKREARHPG